MSKKNYINLIFILFLSLSSCDRNNSKNYTKHQTSSNILKNIKYKNTTQQINRQLLLSDKISDLKNNNVSESKIVENKLLQFNFEANIASMNSKELENYIKDFIDNHSFDEIVQLRTALYMAGELNHALELCSFEIEHTTNINKIYNSNYMKSIILYKRATENYYNNNTIGYDKDVQEIKSGIQSFYNHLMESSDYQTLELLTLTIDKLGMLYAYEEKNANKVMDLFNEFNEKIQLLNKIDNNHVTEIEGCLYYNIAGAILHPNQNVNSFKINKKTIEKLKNFVDNPEAEKKKQIFGKLLAGERTIKEMIINALKKIEKSYNPQIRSQK